MKIKMKRLHFTSETSPRGFSLLELMIVVVLMSLIMGTVLSQIAQVQQRSRDASACRVTCSLYWKVAGYSVVATHW